MPAGPRGVVVALVGHVPAKDDTAKSETAVHRRQKFFLVEVLAAQHAVDVRDRDFHAGSRRSVDEVDDFLVRRFAVFHVCWSSLAALMRMPVGYRTKWEPQSAAGRRLCPITTAAGITAPLRARPRQAASREMRRRPGAAMQPAGTRGNKPTAAGPGV